MSKVDHDEVMAEVRRFEANKKQGVIIRTYDDIARKFGITRQGLHYIISKYRKAHATSKNNNARKNSVEKK